jgi:hypothetical protein
MNNQVLYVDNCTLVIGTVPMAYYPLHYADDQNRCYRYYEKLCNTDGNSTAIFSGMSVGAGGTIRGIWYYKAMKPVTPTVTNVGTWAISNASGITFPATGPNILWWYFQATAAGDSYYYPSGGGANINLEANP